MDKHTQFLVLIDHDGTLCQTSPTAYDSLRYALDHALRVTKLTPKFIQLDAIISQLTGTTEKRLIEELISLYQVEKSKQKLFEEAFYKGRTNWYKTMKSHNEFVFDTYYPDMEQLIEAMAKKSNYHLGLVTGNPSSVIEERLSPHIKKRFISNKKLFGSFGEESDSRKGLIKLAIDKAKSLFEGFSIVKDANGFISNVFYIGDSKHDFIAGLKAKVKAIYIPSRSLQHVKSIKSEEYISLLEEVLEHEMLITNDCASEETFKFVNLREN